VRDKRVEALIKNEVSRLIQQEVKDPKVHDVVITEVDVAKDMSNAKIYFTSYNKDEVKYIQRGLIRSKGFIKKQLVKNLRMRRVPDLVFLVDESGEYGDHIDELLRDLNKPE